MSSTFLFLSLPGEIRNLIYKEIASSSPPGQDPFSMGWAHERSDLSVQTAVPAIMQACRQTRLEYQPFFYRRNCFYLGNSSHSIQQNLDELEELRPAMLRNVRDLVFCVPVHGGKKTQYMLVPELTFTLSLNASSSQITYDISLQASIRPCFPRCGIFAELVTKANEAALQSNRLLTGFDIARLARTFAKLGEGQECRQLGDCKQCKCLLEARQKHWWKRIADYKNDVEVVE